MALYRMQAALSSGRRLHGRRGLKYGGTNKENLRSARRRLHGRRGLKFCCSHSFCLSPRRRLHGRRGLKYPWVSACRGRRSRRLHGRRGLKYALQVCNLVAVQSPPSRAAWIEMQTTLMRQVIYTSPPSRAAWIEITSATVETSKTQVAAFTGGVD